MPLLQRIAGVAVGLVLFIAAFLFASIVLAVAAVGALFLWGWLWWRARTLSRDARQDESIVIEGEYRVEKEVFGDRVDSPHRAGKDAHGGDGSQKT